ncbi:hypothetical protein ACFSLT_08570 [Novosphingobium resinovorum]
MGRDGVFGAATAAQQAFEPPASLAERRREQELDDFLADERQVRTLAEKGRIDARQLHSWIDELDFKLAAAIEEQWIAGGRVDNAAPMTARVRPLAPSGSRAPLPRSA